jgi:hypothetical protein
MLDAEPQSVGGGFFCYSTAMILRHALSRPELNMDIQTMHTDIEEFKQCWRESIIKYPTSICSI